MELDEALKYLESLGDPINVYEKRQIQQNKDDNCAS